MSKSPFLSRFLALSLLIAVVAVFYFLIAVPILEQHRNYDASIQLLNRQIGKFKDIGEQKAALEKQLDAVTRRKGAESGFHEGASETFVGADLQNKVKALVQTGDGSLRSAQTLPGKDESGFRRVAMRAQMTLSPEGLLTVLHGVEAATPYLFVDNLEIRSQTSRRRRGKDVDSEVQLFVSFDVYGYMRSDKP